MENNKKVETVISDIKINLKDSLIDYVDKTNDKEHQQKMVEEVASKLLEKLKSIQKDELK